MMTVTMNSRIETKHEEETNTTTTTNSKCLLPPKSSSSSRRQWCGLNKNPRIVRVSRAFGGKDRHSKVCTVRGLRDRRIRLSVPTAIQLYDLQNKLGLGQPSKVVDWLLDATKQDIDKLPPLQMPPGISFLSQLIPPPPPTPLPPPLPPAAALFESSSSPNKWSNNNINDDDDQENLEGYGGYQLPHHQLSAHNLFPLPNHNNNNKGFNISSSYFQWEPSASSLLSLSPFGNHPYDHHHQQQQQQMYFCPPPPPMAPSVVLPTGVGVMNTASLENEPRQLNHLHQWLPNALVMPTLHLINSPGAKAFSLNNNKLPSSSSQQENGGSSSTKNIS